MVCNWATSVECALKSLDCASRYLVCALKSLDYAFKGRDLAVGLEESEREEREELVNVLVRGRHQLPWFPVLGFDFRHQGLPGFQYQDLWSPV